MKTVEYVVERTLAAMIGDAMPKYDDASWHHGGDFPEDLPPEAGAVHIAMFFAWAVLSGLASREYLDDFSADVQALRVRRRSPGAHLLLMDGKFTDADLSAEGNEFASSYYDAHYLADYEAILGAGVANLYHVPDSWETLDRLAPTLDARLATWRASQRSGPRR